MKVGSAVIMRRRPSFSHFSQTWKPPTRNSRGRRSMSAAGRASAPAPSAPAIAVGEVLVRLQPHLRAAIRPSHPRPLDRDAAAAERHLPRLVAVADGCSLGDMPALSARRRRRPPPRAARPTHRGRRRPKARAVPLSPTQPAPPAPPAPPVAAPAPRVRPASAIRSSWRFLLSIFDGSPTTLPNRSGRGRRDRRPTKFYELRDNLLRGVLGARFREPRLRRP